MMECDEKDGDSQGKFLLGNSSATMAKEVTFRPASGVARGLSLL